MKDAQAFTYLPRTRVAERRLPRVLSRLSARLRGPWLDRQLARGITSWSSPVHAERALQLTSNHTRNRLASSLDTLVERSEMPRSQLSGTPFVPPCREQVREALPQILALSSRLRGAAPVGARGVAQLEILLCDGAGPFYRRSTPAALAVALEDVWPWLEVDV
jgi:hypothetical protein